MLSKVFFALAALATSVLAHNPPHPVAPVVNATTCNGKNYTYNELAGFGSVPSDARDKYGDTISMGSSLTISGWAKQADGSFTGTLYGLPDRGWNTNGSINYVPRIHKFAIVFRPLVAGAPVPAPKNLQLMYLDTILLRDPSGELCTGLDADATGGLNFFGQTLPAATFTGDGFGGPGPGGKRVTIDAEGIAIGLGNTFWISDEYGPYVYKFDASGIMIQAIRPPDAILPLRNGTVSFSADTPPRLFPNQHPIPANPTSGRQNNQGFEGLSISPNGQVLYVMLQSAGRQEGGKNNPTRWHTRLLRYRVDVVPPIFEAEFVVPLPRFTNAAGQVRVAAQSEIHYISNQQLLILPRDSGVGTAMADTKSVYRHIDVVDFSNATNIRRTAYENTNGSIASDDGVLKPGIVESTLCSWLDFNVNSELAKFGLHNGGAQDGNVLNEKWESIGVVPANADGTVASDPFDEYYIFSISDNDFITQNGFINFGQITYQDLSGFNVDNQVLVFKVTLPAHARPLVA